MRTRPQPHQHRSRGRNKLVTRFKVADWSDGTWCWLDSEWLAARRYPPGDPLSEEEVKKNAQLLRATKDLIADLRRS